MLHPFHSDAREKGERASLPGNMSEWGARMLLGNGGIFGAKAPYFIVDFLAGSRRLRARAPNVRESSIGLADPRALQVLRDPMPHFPDNVGKSGNGRSHLT